MAKIVLIGDSLTSCMPKGFVGNECDEIINKGVENIGVRTYRKYFWPRMEIKNVDVYVLLIGVNNILRPDCDYDDDLSMDDLVAKLEDFIDAICSEKKSKLIVQSLYPTSDKNVNDKICYVNRKIEKFCKKENINYVNMYEILCDENGLMKKEYSSDGIHPNIIGYNIIGKYLNQRMNLLNKKR